MKKKVKKVVKKTSTCQECKRLRVQVKEMRAEQADCAQEIVKLKRQVEIWKSRAKTQCFESIKTYEEVLTLNKLMGSITELAHLKANKVSVMSRVVNRILQAASEDIVWCPSCGKVGYSHTGTSGVMICDECKGKQLYPWGRQKDE